MKIVKSSAPNRSVRPYSPLSAFFDDFLSFPTVDEFVSPSLTRVRDLSADIWEDDKNINIKMALPGIEEKDINVSVTGDSIRISGKSQQSEENKEEEGKRYLYRSMSSSYEQSFSLPSKVDADNATATFKNGVLEVKLPKATEIQAKQIKIGS